LATAGRTRRAPIGRWQIADDLAAHSIAFPAIATGVYGFPPEEAAQIAVTTIASAPTSVQRVRLIAFDKATHDLLTTELAQRSASG
jgi:O-acetyl-ADP-ribose deacetylase (regulator of RNase III)